MNKMGAHNFHNFRLFRANRRFFRDVDHWWVNDDGRRQRDRRPMDRRQRAEYGHNLSSNGSSISVNVREQVNIHVIFDISFSSPSKHSYHHKEDQASLFASSVGGLLNDVIHYN
jgi:hypothetical protein